MPTLLTHALLGMTLRHCKPSKDPSADCTRFRYRLLYVQLLNVALWLVMRGRSRMGVAVDCCCCRLWDDDDDTATAPSRQHEMKVGMEYEEVARLLARVHLRQETPFLQR